jgi:hypothetical protein
MKSIPDSREDLNQADSMNDSVQHICGKNSAMIRRVQAEFQQKTHPIHA